MHAFILQDWITIRGQSTTPVNQSEDCWLDLSPYQDLIVWVDCREVSGSTTPTIAIQTSPNKDDVLFVAAIAAQTLVTSGVQVYRNILSGIPTFPLARWVRWQLVGPSTLWDATFRVLVTANSPGM